MSRRSIAFAFLLALAGSLLAAGPGASAGPGTFTLTVTKTGNGNGTVTSDVQPGISCGATCAFAFPLGTPVELSAVAGTGSTFVGWSGPCSGTGTCQVAMDQARSVQAAFQRNTRPDGWIKLCGLSDGCTIHGLPNPWKGKNIYNSTGRRQRIGVRMEDGEGVRFWFTFENDGAQADTFVLEGCKGTPKFRVNKVQIGFYKRPTAGSIKITEEFKKGTATFDFGPSSANDKVEITLNIIAPTTAEGVTYRCPVTIRSQSDPSVEDTMMTKMTTY